MPASTLVATLEAPASPMRARDAKLVYTIENRGAQPVMLPRDEMGSAILVLAVHDADGKPRYTIPPGQPPIDYERRLEELKPGQTWRFELTLNVFSPELAPGSYTAQLRSGGSNVVTFVIR